MAPNYKDTEIEEDSSVIARNGKHDVKPAEDMPATPTKPYRVEIVWSNVFVQIGIHIAAIYGVYLIFTGRTMIYTALWAFVLYCYGALGVTGGSHRLWSHKAYKASLPFRLFIALGATIAFQNSIFEWCRDHRAHHKFTETDGDPHNAKRGFFFSHMGWLMVKKHPKVIEQGRKLDMSDLWADPVVKYQHKYIVPITLVCSLILPTYIPTLWGERIGVALFANIARYVCLLHATWTVNSVAHIWGNRPYDETIDPSEALGVTILTLGEGFHNFHHSFPFDYRASEFPFMINPTTWLLDSAAFLGQVWDRRTASRNQIEGRSSKHGDGTIGRYFHFF